MQVVRGVSSSAVLVYMRKIEEGDVKFGGGREGGGNIYARDREGGRPGL
jgi:hypothetical protein